MQQEQQQEQGTFKAQLVGSISTLLADQKSDVRAQVVVAVSTKLDESSCAGYLQLSEEDRRNALLVLAQQQAGGAAAAAAAAPEVALAITRLEAQVVQQQAKLTQMVQLLVNDRLRPRSSSTSKQQRNRKCREEAIAYYYPQQGKAPTKLRCMLLDEELDAAQVVAAHIYQLHWPPEFARHLGLAMNDPRNLLLVVGAAEKRFDDLQWTLKPLVPSMGVGPEGRLRSQQTFKVLVLDPALLDPSSSNQHTIAGHVSRQTWSSVHGKLLQFTEGEGMPYRRACALHAARALQYAVEQGWAADHLFEEDTRVEEAAYAASPMCDATRFRQFLESAAAVSEAAKGSDGDGLSD